MNWRITQAIEEGPALLVTAESPSIVVQVAVPLAALTGLTADQVRERIRQELRARIAGVPAPTVTRSGLVGPIDLS
jgi:hypothetical protein